MEFSAQQIADVINGKVDGNPEVKVHFVSKIEEGKKGTLSFLANPKYTKYIYSTQASIVIVQNDFEPDQELNTTLIRVDDAYSGFAKLLEFYNEFKLNKSGISEKASISEHAIIGKDVYIGDFAVISENVIIGDGSKIYPQVFIGENTKIGENTTLFAGCKIYPETVIGNACNIHSGAVIGSDGFGFAPQTTNDYIKIAQIGNVIIEDHVEVGANTTIDRATLGSTIIRKGVKLDNLIQVAHNVEIGENTVIAAQTGISGSTKIGKNCLFGGQIGLAGHLEIADDVKIQAQSGIGKSIKKQGEVVQGTPAFGIMSFNKSYIHFKNLPNIVSRINDLEKNSDK